MGWKKLRKSKLDLVREAYKGTDVRCQVCQHFAGSGQWGRCGLSREKQFAYGLCLDFDTGLSFLPSMPPQDHRVACDCRQMVFGFVLCECVP